MRPTGRAELSDAVYHATGGLWSLDRLRLVRFRHRPRERVILQVDTRLRGPRGPVCLPASIWLHAGGKTAKVAARLPPVDRSPLLPPTALIEPRSGALIQFFPHDYRVPQIARFVTDHQRYAPRLFAESSVDACPPKLVRYRPGLGATFYWRRKSGKAIYVKIFAEADDCGLADQLFHLGAVSQPSFFKVPRLIGRADEIAAISVEAARGRSFDDILAAAGISKIRHASLVVVDAIGEFHAQAAGPKKIKDHRELVRRAKRAAALVGAVSSVLGQRAATLSDWVECSARPIRLRPAHMDIKIEHLVVAGQRCTILDLDSMALSDPGYDFVMLERRITDAAACEHCSKDQAGAALAAIDGVLKNMTPERLKWLGAICTLQIARHHAQSGHPARLSRIAKTLDQWQ